MMCSNVRAVTHEAHRSTSPPQLFKNFIFAYNLKIFFQFASMKIAPCIFNNFALTYNFTISINLSSLEIYECPLKR